MKPKSEESALWIECTVQQLRSIPWSLSHDPKTTATTVSNSQLPILCHWIWVTHHSGSIETTATTVSHNPATTVSKSQLPILCLWIWAPGHDGSIQAQSNHSDHYFFTFRLINSVCETIEGNLYLCTGTFYPSMNEPNYHFQICFQSISNLENAQNVLVKPGFKTCQAWFDGTFSDKPRNPQWP